MLDTLIPGSIAPLPPPGASTTSAQNDPIDRENRLKMALHLIMQRIIFAAYLYGVAVLTIHLRLPSRDSGVGQPTN